MKPKLLMTRAVFPEVVEALAVHFEVQDNQADQALDKAGLIARMQDKQALFAMPGDQLDREFLAACPHLKMLGLMAVGFNNVDLQAATERGIMVSNTPDVLTESTADFGFALLMAAARRVTESEHWLRAGHWQSWRFDSFLGMDLYKSTLGILGMGRIGQALARRAAGFQMQVLYHNRSRLTADEEKEAGSAQWVSKEELLRRADHLVLLLPYSAHSHHAIGAPELAMMKPDAVLVNLARGGIVDDVALIAALRSGRLAAAGLDVFENEPRLHPDFLSLKNVVLTPHIASATRATRLAMANCTVHNLLAMLHDGRPRDWVNPFPLPRG